jgi:hypothetical protein
MKFIKTFEELSPEVYRRAADLREEDGDPYGTVDDLKKHADDIESGNFPTKHLLYYAFDWDDNILEMPTEIMVLTEDGGEIGMSTSDFAEHRSKLGVENFEYKGKIVVGVDNNTAFRNFRDQNDSEVFKKDVIKAIESNSISPSWDDFMECLSNGSLFAIITARGHEKEAMRSGVEWIIDNILTKKTSKDLNLSLADQMYNNLRKFAHLFGDKTEYGHFLDSQPSQHPLVKTYLDNCDFVGVSAPSRGGSPANPEAAKEDALKSFIKKVNSFAKGIGFEAMVGFSDDDPKNVKHIEEAFEDLKKSIGNEELSNVIKLVLKGVGKASLKADYTKESYVYKKFEDFSPGVLNSLPNAAMSGSMNSQNPYETSKIQQSNFLSKLSNEIFKNFNENDKKERKNKYIKIKNKK